MPRCLTAPPWMGSWKSRPVEKRGHPVALVHLWNYAAAVGALPQHELNHLAPGREQREREPAFRVPCNAGRITWKVREQHLGLVGPKVEKPVPPRFGDNDPSIGRDHDPVGKREARREAV